MQLLNGEWAFTNAALLELQDYLLSRELYWRLTTTLPGQSSDQPSTLTPGNLLLCLRQIAAYPFPPENKAAVGELQTRFETIRNHWQTKWMQKANRDVQARLRQWQAYLQESVDEDGRLVDYAFQVRQRVIIELLIQDGVDWQPHLENQLAVLDAQLNMMTLPAPFVWKSDISAGFPEEQFWFLYRAYRKGK